MLSRTNTLNFYRKKTLNPFFLNENFGSLKVFGSNSAPKNWFLDKHRKKMFFSIQYLNILKFIKTVVTNMYVLFYKKWLLKHFFMNVTKKIIKHFAKKVLGCSKLLFLAFLNTLKLFLAKYFIIFFSHSSKILFQPFLYFF